jgi:signal peptidase I
VKAGRDSGAEARVWAVAELLRRQIADGATRVAVTSTSMGPLARRGDAFVFEPLGARGARFGDVVLAVAGGKAVTHRVVGRRGGFYIVKGDGSSRRDPPVAPAEVVARARTLVKENGRTVPLRTLRSRLVGAALASVSRVEGAVTDAFYPPPPLVRKISYLSSRVLCLLLGA